MADPETTTTPSSAVAADSVFQDWLDDVTTLELCLGKLGHLSETAAIARIVGQTRDKLTQLAAKEIRETAERLLLT